MTTQVIMEVLSTGISTYFWLQYKKLHSTNMQKMAFETAFSSVSLWIFNIFDLRFKERWQGQYILFNWTVKYITIL